MVFKIKPNNKFMCDNLTRAQKYARGVIFDILIDILTDEAENKCYADSQLSLQDHQEILSNAEQLLAIICKNNYLQFASKLYVELQDAVLSQGDGYCYEVY